MAVEGKYAYYTPEIASIFDECFERAGVDPGKTGVDAIASAFRSLYLILNSEWQTLGMRTWMFKLLSFTTTPGFGPPGIGGSIVALPPFVLTVSDAILRRDRRDTPLNVMSRNEYLEIPDKQQQGRPDRYFVERLSGPPPSFAQNSDGGLVYNDDDSPVVTSTPNGLGAVNMYLWRSPENNTDQIHYWAFCVMSQPGQDLSYTLDVRPEMLEALHADLSARIALKFNAQRYQMLQDYYRGSDPNPRNIGGVLALALDANRDFGDVRFSFYRPRRGRRS